MKVICPWCKQIIDLGYLENKGDQMAQCPKCNTIVAATFKKDKNRLYWEVYFERPISKREPRGGGCGTTLWIVIALFLLTLMAVARCDLKVPDRPLGGASREQFQN